MTRFFRAILSRLVLLAGLIIIFPLLVILIIINPREAFNQIDRFNSNFTA